MATEDKNISYHPTDGLCYDPDLPLYWQPDALRKEVTRAFEICQGCRMCFKFCDVFPKLFKLVDEKYAGDIHRLSPEEIDDVLEACFQCKLCEVQCPYTPRDKHAFMLDFPKLVHRYKALRARVQGFSLRDRFLANPDQTGKLARASLGMANYVNRLRPQRLAMELALGIHRDKLLPEFAPQPFDALAKRTGRMRRTSVAEVVVFQTCYVQHNEPQIGLDLLFVLEKNCVDAVCVEGLVCCGMPAWEHGDLEALRKQAAHNMGLLMPYVELGAKILVLNPTCAMMMRREYPELLPEKEREAAQKLAAAIRDPGEFLWSIRNEPRFNTRFESTPGTVAYHAPCHLRAQAIGFKGRDLLRKIPGVSPKTVMECCGHNGTFAMRLEGFEPSIRIGQRAFDAMKETDAEVWATECPLAAVQFEQHAGRKPLHPISILARAYRPNGFPKRITQV